MVKHKTADIEGALLDAAVAKAEGATLGDGYFQWPQGDGTSGWWRQPTEEYSTSTDWQHGGPIIQRERIALRPDADGWVADWMGDHGAFVGLGPTPLTAAMRAYVASKFGDEVGL